MQNSESSSQNPFLKVVLLSDDVLGIDRTAYSG